MKKLLAIFFAASVLAACGNNGESNDDVDVNSAPVTPGIDNVNGNIPDTGETIRLNRPLPTDSVTNDTMPPR